MRAVLWFLALAALAVTLTLAARFDTGYVLLVYPPWRIEMSLILALAVLLGGYVLLTLLLGVLRMALSLPGDVRAWQARRRRHKSEDELSRATAALLAGQAAHAAKLVAQAIARRPTPLAALIAARAAADLGDVASARQHLLGVGSEIGELVAARQATERELAHLESIEPAASDAKSLIASTS